MAFRVDSLQSRFCASGSGEAMVHVFNERHLGEQCFQPGRPRLAQIELGLLEVACSPVGEHGMSDEHDKSRFCFLPVRL